MNYQATIFQPKLESTTCQQQLKCHTKPQRKFKAEGQRRYSG